MQVAFQSVLTMKYTFLIAPESKVSKLYSATASAKNL
jgi:hypothetical protein